MSQVPAIEPFPVWALLPKKETTAAAYLTKYPNFDGRGTKIAIFDSGVDPGAPGLQITTDGKPKIIEMMDATGAGDVDTSTVVEVDKDDTSITTLTGRQVQIPAAWVNPSGKYHIGVKNAYELYPKTLRERMAKEYIDKNFSPEHKTLQADALAKLNKFTAKTANNQNGLSSAERLEKEELQAAVDNLVAIEKKFTDLGPTYDCILFHDGSDWQVAIDSSDDGDLNSVQLLSAFSKSQKYRNLTPRDKMNIAVNIHDDGNLLEIVSIPTSHGTHVASIATANFPDCPEKNGVAPGAQVVSIGIGDARLGSMEVGPALIRAANKIASLGVDVINMSYGEHSHWTGGRIMEALQELVNKYGVIYCGSAGNRGPALSTVGTPPICTTSCILGIGAYVSPDMMAAEYSMRSKVPAQEYTWTSRGPTPDGDLGVTICAPGGAITSVPQYTLKCSQLMNGTSMASPNAAGCMCLIVSGLKQEQIPYSTYSVRRAVEATAAKVPGYDPLAMGHGLIQVERAFEHLSTFRQLAEQDIRFNISVNSNKKGIYLRQANVTSAVTVHAITVDPVLLNAAEREPDDKLAFDMNFALVCDAPWVQTPTHLNMCYASRGFSVRVDPTGLTPGLHTTFIRAYDVTAVEKGIVFQIPINVLKPTVLDESKQYKVSRQLALRPGQIIREFVDPPNGTTGLVVTFKNLSKTEPSHFIVHIIQLQPQSSCRTTEIEKFFSLEAGAEVSHAIAIRGTRNVEVALGKWWSSLGDAELEYSIELFGLQPSVSSVVMQASQSLYRIDLTNSLKGSKFEPVLPKVELKTAVVPLRPSESKIAPLGPRDVIPDGQRQIYENVLTYNFSVAQVKGGLEVGFFCPLLSDILYESEFDAQMVMLFDSNKQLLLTSDAYPDKYQTKLDKGDYTARFQLRHESTAVLEKLNDLTLCLIQKLATPLSLDAFSSYKLAMLDGKKFTETTIKPGVTAPVFFASPQADKLPKGVTISSGTYLSGTVTFAKDEIRKKVESYPFKFVIDSESAKAKSGKAAATSAVSTTTTASTTTTVSTLPVGTSEQPCNKCVEASLSIEEQFAEALKDLKVTWLGKLSGKTSEDLFDELNASLKGGSDKSATGSAPGAGGKSTETTTPVAGVIAATLGTPTDKRAALLLSKIQSLENEPDRSNNLRTIIGLADELVSKVNVNELVGALAAAKQEKKENSGNGCTSSKILEKQKNHLVEALVKKGLALCDLLSAGADADASSNQVLVAPDQSDLKTEDADFVYFELLKLIGNADGAMYENTKVVAFVEKHSALRGHSGRLIKCLLKQQETGNGQGGKPPTWTLDSERKLIDALDKTGWPHAARLLKRTQFIKFPTAYRLF